MIAELGTSLSYKIFCHNSIAKILQFFFIEQSEDQPIVFWDSMA